MFTLHNGDCLEYMKSLEGGSVCVVSDPPYGLRSLMQGGGWAKKMTYIRDGAEWDENPATAEQIAEIMRVGKSVILWGGNYFNLPPARGWLVWNKRGMGFSMAQAELAWTNIDMPVRVYDHYAISQKPLHPTEKPLSLMLWVIENFTNENDIVFDPFMGSGTTGAACVQLGRKFIGCEISAEYFAIAEKRLKLAAQSPSFLTPSNNRLHLTGGGLPATQSSFTAEVIPPAKLPAKSPRR